MVDAVNTAFARGLHSRTNSFDQNANGLAGHSTHLSSLFRCPVLRDVFRRVERDNDGAFAVPAPKAPVLDGGASFRSARDLVLA